MSDDANSLTLEKLRETWERFRREHPEPDRYELRVRSIAELQQALGASSNPGISVAALEASGIRVYVVEIIPPWRAVLFNVSEFERADEDWSNHRITTVEWLRRGNACMSIIDLAEPRPPQ